MRKSLARFFARIAQRLDPPSFPVKKVVCQVCVETNGQHRNSVTIGLFIWFNNSLLPTELLRKHKLRDSQGRSVLTLSQSIVRIQPLEDGALIDFRATSYNIQHSDQEEKMVLASLLASFGLRVSYRDGNALIVRPLHSAVELLHHEASAKEATAVEALRLDFFSRLRVTRLSATEARELEKR